MSAMQSKFSNDEYTIGWICNLQEEFDVATAMLTREHGVPQSIPKRDNNAYILGEIGSHKIVMACLPAGRMGTNPAAVVADNMRRTFKSIRFGLLVGIGGGVPNPDKGKDIRLGDVVVSVPTGSYGGVVQYDFGKTEAAGVFKHRGQLNAPPEKLLSYVSLLQNFLSRLKNPKNYVREFLEELEECSEEYGYPDKDDKLFQSNCQHNDKYDMEDVCTGCDKSQEIPRKKRKNTDPVVYMGTIASGNTVIADSMERDRISKEYGNMILCFDMEAAGLMNNFPCLVIRGISDYADSHKNDHWRNRAIAAASAYAKALISLIRPTEVSAMLEVAKVMDLGKCEPQVKRVTYRASFSNFHDIHSAKCQPKCYADARADKGRVWISSRRDDLAFIPI
jgi:nucleoside phosphorylase